MRLNNKMGSVTISIMKRLKKLMNSRFRNSLFLLLLLATSALAAVVGPFTVNPGTLPQGAIDEVIITATGGFQNGVTVEITGGGVVVPSVSVETSSQIRANVIVASDATPSARDIKFYNLGESGVTASGYFSITASGTGPAMSVWFSGTKYTNPRAAAVYPTITVDPTFEVTLTVTSTLPATLEATVMNGSVLLYTGTGASQVFTSGLSRIPTADVTAISSTELRVFTTIESGLAPGICNIIIGANDATNQSGQFSGLIYIATASDVDDPSDISITTEVSRNDKVVVIPPQSVIDPSQTKIIPLQVRIAPGRSIRNFTVILYNSNFKVVSKKAFTYNVDQTNKINLDMVLGDDMPVSNGIHTFVVLENGKKIGSGKITFWKP